jgi:wyosine [tRNA(Phe)-imidazoG37] synthetase (radical SAM superfamily)
VNGYPRKRGIIYGPVRSRRFGLSLGVNLSGPAKYCSFDCLYCFRGPNDGRPSHPGFRAGLPSIDGVLSALDEWLSNGEAIDDIAVAGNAEPTDHPEFLPIIEGLVSIRGARRPGVRITVLTNGMGLVPRFNPGHESVGKALGLVDNPCLKLDSGLQETWKKLSRPTDGITLEEWLEAACAVFPPALQTMFVQGSVDNTTPSELDALSRAYARLRPQKVFLLTINKPPADSGLTPVSVSRLSEIELTMEQYRARAVR